MSAFNSRLSILALLLLTLSACTFKTKPSALAGSATFRVDSVRGTVTSESVIKGWNIPQERRFNLAVCVKSVSGRDDIISHPFEISGGGAVFHATSDSSGCVNWSEVLGFDYLAKPTYINLKRGIKSLGVQRGSVAFEIAVNPWSGLLGSEAAVADLTRVRVLRIADSDVKMSALKADRSQTTEIEVESVRYRMDINNPSASQDAALHLEFQPSLVLHDMSGLVQRQAIERGEFLVKPYVFRLDDASGTKKTLVHADIAPIAAHASNGVVIVNAPLHFSAVNLDPQKSYALALTVVAVNGPAYIADYSRLYKIPQFSQLQGGTVTLESDPSSTNFLTGATGLGAPAPSEAGAGFFIVGRIAGGNNGISDESMMERRVKLSLSAEIRWAVNLSPLQNRKFRVYSMQAGPDGKKRVITPQGPTDPAGMLNWEDEIVHSIYKKQERMRFEIVLEDVATGKKISRCAVANPWDFWATFFRDCSEVNDSAVPASERLQSPVVKVPFLKVDGLCTARTDTEISNSDIFRMIQPDLSLVVRHRYNMQLNASVLRFDDLRTGLQTPAENLRGGWWLMTVAVFRNSPAAGTVGDRDQQGNLKPVATFEKAICNPGTQPAAEIELALKDLSLMDRLNYLAVQIRPLDQSRLRFQGPTGGEVSGPYCTGFELAPDSPVDLDRNNDLMSPPYIFPMNMRQGGCPIVVSHGNFEDARLKDLQNKLLQTDLHQLHQKLQADRKAEAAEAALTLQASRAVGWKGYGKSLGLTPLLIGSDEDAAQFVLGEKSGASIAQVFTLLECLNQTFWADKTHQAKCTLDPNIAALAAKLCARTVDHYGLLGGLSDCGDPLRDFLVEEKLHVYKVGDSNYSSGFSTSLTVTNSFALGEFNGSDFGHAMGDSAAVAASGGVSVGKGPVSLGADVSASKSWSAFNINFVREWTDNQVGVASSTTLTVENADINIRVDEYRHCYVVRSRDESKAGKYVCFEPQREPMWRQERYFVIFNPGFNGSMLNSNDERNRWLLQFRGERFFYHLMASLNDNFAPFNIDGTSVLITDILKRSYGQLSERTGWGDPYVLSTIAPGLDKIERTDGSVRNLPVLGFHPFRDFGNKAFRDQNDPSLRVHDHDNNFK